MAFIPGSRAARISRKPAVSRRVAATRARVTAATLAATLAAAPLHAALPACAGPLPAQGAALRGSGPLFPADNWWNTDISSAPVDGASSAYITHVGATRSLHPDFGGTAGGDDIYGMPYAVVGVTQPRLAVRFHWPDQSDGVDPVTLQPVPWYPVPAEAIMQAHWVEGGAPGRVDQRPDADRHLLIVDCQASLLFELYNVWYDTAHAQWYAGSGAVFDFYTNARRTEGWTSADAAGLAILPGLVRYDEAWNDAVTDIGHAFRVTVRDTNGYVYPASHVAGDSVGALPLGARLRLRKLVDGVDPVTRSSDPHVQKIFRAMQRYGLIVADNGSDMYIGGTFDTRWDNDILNPAFAKLKAGDFEVIQLGWKPAGAPPTARVEDPPERAPASQDREAAAPH